MINYKYILTSLVLCAATTCSCSSDEPGDGSETKPDQGGGESSVTDVRTVKSSLTVDLSTDRACYTPGSKVTFTASSVPSGAKIRYRHGAEVISEQDMTGTTWTWTAPSKDYMGYLVDIYKMSGENEETVLGTIGVDVSSDWTVFPRYGFVATFDGSKLADGVIEGEMEFLNRCHINGVQFQDWHYKHHWPLGGTRDNLLDVYKDIANRDVYTSVVKKYINVQHGYGMKSIFYNLCFGALDDAASDGVKEEWYLFKNTQHSDKDFHGLPSSWKSDIFLVDPSNPEWQAYLAERNDEVYSNIDFDGYQIDQLGYRGNLYDYNGNAVNLPKGYASFIEAMKKRHPDKRLVMNAVGSYGASQICGTGKVDFCYNEMWNDEDQFSSLYNVIKANDTYSNHTLRTVFAAYMNYDKADRETGYFNTPGVLLTDAVMFALGGAHLELGDHMLSREYFPASPLAMDEELKTAIVRYYDFATAYQNYLRQYSSQNETVVTMSCTDASKKISINSWPPKQGNISTYAKTVDGATVVHLLNFRNTDDMSWRDLNGTRPAPRLTLNLPVALTCKNKVSKVWVASPDSHAGAIQELEFKQSGTTVTFTVPSIKYWTMLVIE